MMNGDTSLLLVNKSLKEVDWIQHPKNTFTVLVVC